MAISKMKTGFVVLVLAGAAALIFLQYQTQQKLRAENDSLRQQMAQLKPDNQDSAASNSNPTSSKDFDDLLRLRGEVSALRSQTNQIAKLQAQNQQLHEASTNLAQLKQQQQDADSVEAKQQAFLRVQVNTAKQSILAMIMYANDNQDQFPTNFNQAASYYKNDPEFASLLEQFVIAYHGALANIANPGSAIVVRSFQPFMSHGKWTKAYGFADGHVKTHSDPDGNFDDWEQQHVPVMKSQ